MQWVLIPILALVLLHLQMRLWASEGALEEVQTLRAKIDAQHRENEQLRTRNQALDAEVRDLKQGLEAIEERARIDVELLDPFREVTVDEATFDMDYIQAQAPSAAIAVGLAMRYERDNL